MSKSLENVRIPRLPAWIETHSYDPESFSGREPVVYFLLVSDNLLVYVGSSNKIRHRLRQHRQIFKGCYDRVLVYPCPTIGAAVDLEQEMIAIYDPPLNRADTPSRKTKNYELNRALIWTRRIRRDEVSM
jgi:hypothetical protein